MVGRPRLSDEERREHRAAGRERVRQLNCMGGVHYARNGEKAPTDEGDDPFPLTQHGENRLRFNLGDGCRMRPRHNT